MSKPYTMAKAMPGSVRCPSGPATSDMRLPSIREPRYPAAPPMNMPEARLKKRESMGRYSCLCS